MKKFFGKKRAAALSVVAVLAVAAAALAYWTTSGSGTGTGSVSAGASDLTVTDTSALAAMYPGDTAQNLSGTIKNNAGNSVKITSVTPTVTVVKDPSNTAAGTCDDTDFTIAGTSPMTSFTGLSASNELASGSTASFSGATIKFNNKTTNQDACKGAAVTVHYTVNSL
jgi:hypothetical protein